MFFQSIAKYPSPPLLVKPFAGFLVALAITPFASGIEVSVETVNETVQGELEQITSSHIVVNRNETAIEIPFEQALILRSEGDEAFQASKSNQIGEVTLIDGSLCYHTAWQTSARPNSLSFSNESFEQWQFSMPISAIHSWRLPGPALPSELTHWQDLITSSPVSDLLVIRRRSNGELKWIEGVIEQINEEDILFRIGEDTLTVGWDRIFGLIFFQQEKAVTAGPRVKLVDHSRFVSDELFTDARGLNIRTPSGAMLKTSLDSLFEIDYSIGKVFSLSDLPIVLSNWDSPADVPRQLDFKPRFNRSFDNQPLRLSLPDERVPGLWQTNEFAEGVALRSNSQLALALPDGVRWLKGRIGIDPTTRQTGSAELVILLNNKIIERLPIDGADPARQIKIALPDESYERELTLRVEPGLNRDVGDNVHFVEARVTK